MSLKPASAKAKGRKLCHKVVTRFLAAFPDLKPDDVVVTSSGANGEDIRLSPLARSRVPYQVEWKKRASISLVRDYEQAQRHGPHEPVLIVEEDRGAPLVMNSSSEFMRLISR